MIAIQYTRAGALLAAGLTAASTAGLEVAWPVRPQQRVATQRLQSPPELATFAALGREDPGRGERALRAAMKHRLAHGDPRSATPPRPRAVFPVRGAVGFGSSGARFGAARGGHMHQGQDVFAPSGTPLVAVTDGVVVEAGNGGGRGNYVAIFSSAAQETYVYFHMLQAAEVQPGERVEAGQRVGSVGCTGSCWGDHLHFEQRQGQGSAGAPKDPLPLLMRLPRG